MERVGVRMKEEGQLRSLLERIDGRGYKAYKDIQGRYQFSHANATFTLHIDYVQGDPFAGPSRLRVIVPQSVAQYPLDTYHNAPRQIGLENFLAAVFGAAARQVAKRSGSGKSGLIEIDAPGQTVLARTAVLVSAETVEARFIVGLPAQGRRVLGRAAARMLCDDLPKIVTSALIYANNRHDLLTNYVEVNEDADVLRQQIGKAGLIAFVANGSILPRRSGIDFRPMSPKSAVRFQSPPSLEQTFTLPNHGPISGMAIPRGVTLIVGGGFHGKSTLLNALELGVYNHKPGDGREFVVCDPTAVKIRAEDGRSVAGVDISPFINNLPHGRDTRRFSTENASGSTSQAANIIEALELNAQTLLIDEDTAATNFMIRDQRMQSLIAKQKEPITPFIDKVRQLFDERGVSTILVVGGSGDYFDVADLVIAMDEYVPHDVTARAKEIAAAQQTGRNAEGGASFGPITPRTPDKRSIDPRRGRRDVHIKTRNLVTISFGEEDIDLYGVSQLIDPSQTRAVADAINYARERYMNANRSLAEVLDLVMSDIDRHGLDVLSRSFIGHYATFRKHELGAALNRLRSLQIR